MADQTHIEWADATWNPITGCSVVSPGCTNCYAMRLAGTRLKDHPSRQGLTTESKAGPVWNGQVRFNEQWIDQPLTWAKPRRIFVCAHNDLFHEGVPDAWIDQVFARMALTPHHVHQVLTKRAERMRAYCNDRRTPGRIYDIVCDLTLAMGLPVVLIAPGADASRAPEGPKIFLDQWPLPNVWLGVSVEDQDRARRVYELMRTRAAKRWISVEPMLGSVNLTSIDVNGDAELDALNAKIWGDEFEDWRETSETWFADFLDWYDLAELPDLEKPMSHTLDWVVVGGESGPGARPMHPDWARRIRDDCASAGVPFFFKQWGDWAPAGPANLRPRDVSAAYWFDDISDLDGPDLPPPDMLHVGKRRAGRLLDGVTHDAMPDGAR